MRVQHYPLRDGLHFAVGGKQIIVVSYYEFRHLANYPLNATSGIVIISATTAWRRPEICSYACVGLPAFVVLDILTYSRMTPPSPLLIFFIEFPAAWMHLSSHMRHLIRVLRTLKYHSLLRDQTNGATFFSGVSSAQSEGRTCWSDDLFSEQGRDPSVRFRQQVV